ncbi:MAG: hypothetical protein SVR04_11035 [Spirochaetota bacterium]|nr:hypothetical protein [Spirochaetota bacterium]
MDYTPQNGLGTGLARPVPVLCILVFFFLLVCTANAPLYAEDIKELRNILEEGDWGAADTETVLEIVREAALQGIPPEMIVPRIKEGLAKNVAAPRLAAAIEKEISLLIEARKVIRDVPGAEDFAGQFNLWQRTANLLSAGISSGETRSLIEVCLRETEAFQPASALYVVLTEWGLPKEYSLRIVRAAVSSDLDYSEYSLLPSLFARARRDYIAPEDMVGRIVSELPNVGSVRQLENRVLDKRR